MYELADIARFYIDASNGGDQETEEALLRWLNDTINKTQDTQEKS